MSEPISQREARSLKKRVAQLERERADQRNRWVCQFPGGVHLGQIRRERDALSGRIEAARLLGHAVVVTEGGDGHLDLYALPLGKEAS